MAVDSVSAGVELVRLTVDSVLVQAVVAKGAERFLAFVAERQTLCEVLAGCGSGPITEAFDSEGTCAATEMLRSDKSKVGGGAASWAILAL